MSELEKAAKQALEALELAQDNLRDHGDNCFLHDEGEYNRCFCGKDSLADHLQEVVETLDTALRQALEKPAQQEPVAGQSRFPNVAWSQCDVKHVRMVLDNPHEWKGYEVRYLYDSPQAREPLSDEKIETIHQSTWIQSTATLNDFARAIEAKLKEKNT